MQRGLLGYQEVLDLQNDPVLGCIAIKSNSKAFWGGYMASFDNCTQYLDDNKTKQGEDMCFSNSDCYSLSCDNGTQTCTPPSNYLGSLRTCFAPSLILRSVPTMRLPDCVWCVAARCVYALCERKPGCYRPEFPERFSWAWARSIAGDPDRGASRRGLQFK